VEWLTAQEAAQQGKEDHEEPAFTSDQVGRMCSRGWVLVVGCLWLGACSRVPVVGCLWSGACGRVPVVGCLWLGACSRVPVVKCLWLGACGWVPVVGGLWPRVGAGCEKGLRSLPGGGR